MFRWESRGRLHGFVQLWPAANVAAVSTNAGIDRCAGPVLVAYRPTSAVGPAYPSWSRWKWPDTATHAPSRRAQLSV